MGSSFWSSSSSAPHSGLEVDTAAVVEATFNVETAAGASVLTVLTIALLVREEVEAVLVILARGVVFSVATTGAVAAVVVLVGALTEVTGATTVAVVVSVANESRDANPVDVGGEVEGGADEVMKWLNAAIELPGMKGTAEACKTKGLVAGDGARAAGTGRGADEAGSAEVEVAVAGAVEGLVEALAVEALAVEALAVEALAVETLAVETVAVEAVVVAVEATAVEATAAEETVEAVAVAGAEIAADIEVVGAGVTREVVGVGAAVTGVGVSAAAGAAVVGAGLGAVVTEDAETGATREMGGEEVDTELRAAVAPGFPLSKSKEAADWVEATPGFFQAEVKGAAGTDTALAVIGAAGTDTALAVIGAAEGMATAGAATGAVLAGAAVLVVVVELEVREGKVAVVAAEELEVVAVAALSPFSPGFFSPDRLRVGLTGSGRLRSATDFPQAAPGMVPEGAFGRATLGLSQKKEELFSGAAKVALAAVTADSAGTGAGTVAFAVGTIAAGVETVDGPVLTGVAVGAGTEAGATRGAGTPQPFGALLTAGVADAATAGTVTGWMGVGGRAGWAA